MRSNLNRLGPFAMLIGLALLAVPLNTRTEGRAAAPHQEHINIDSFHWGITQPQMLRICLGSAAASPRGSGPVIENFAVSFEQIDLEFAPPILETKLQVPRRGSRCTDFSYPQLVAAGLNPESSGRIEFRIVFSPPESQGRTETVGGAQAICVGAIQTIGLTGETSQYQQFVFKL